MGETRLWPETDTRSVDDHQQISGFDLRGFTYRMPDGRHGLLDWQFAVGVTRGNGWRS